MGTRTDMELEAARALVAELEARKLAEEAAKATATPAVRALAVALHQLLCQNPHPEGCTWYEEPAASDPEGADWTQGDHEWWLTTTRAALGGMVRTGWTVIPPGETDPLPPDFGTSPGGATPS